MRIHNNTEWKNPLKSGHSEILILLVISIRALFITVIWYLKAFHIDMWFSCITEPNYKKPLPFTLTYCESWGRRLWRHSQRQKILIYQGYSIFFWIYQDNLPQKGWIQSFIQLLIQLTPFLWGYCSLPLTSQPGLDSKTTGIVLGISLCKNRDNFKTL